jgi:hypothetical protein
VARAKVHRATGAIIAKPKIKLPCRFAQRHEGKQKPGGELRVSTARINTAIQATITGSARM